MSETGDWLSAPSLPPTCTWRCPSGRHGCVREAGHRDDGHWIAELECFMDPPPRGCWPHVTTGAQNVKAP